MVIIIKCNNGTVTDTYLETIGECIEETGRRVKYVNTVTSVYSFPKTTLIVVARNIDAMHLFIKGYKNVIMWFQGVEPEESFMNHKSKIRFIILSIMEKYILKHTKFNFFVSEAMRNHYKKKYGFCKENYYCMPCLNTRIHEESFNVTDKYSNNYFAYVGSMAVWQKFEYTAMYYKKIEGLKLTNTKFFVFTNEQDIAKKILEKCGISNYSIAFVKNEELPNVLKEIKYGFIIRDDNIVNKVATPTKISTYLSNGMIPIYSECLRDFNAIAKNMKYVVKHDQESLKKISSPDFLNISKKNILEEYKNIFSTYYNAEYHKKNIIRRLSKYL